jgi:hypothetical protein
MTKTTIDVKQYFLKLNRNLTTSLVAILLAVSAVFWYTKAVTLENSSIWIGAAFMLLAVLFYQLPYVSYLLTQRHFESADRSSIEILYSDWKAFRRWLDT